MSWENTQQSTQCEVYCMQFCICYCIIEIPISFVPFHLSNINSQQYTLDIYAISLQPITTWFSTIHARIKQMEMVHTDGCACADGAFMYLHKFESKYLFYITFYLCMLCLSILCIYCIYLLSDCWPSHHKENERTTTKKSADCRNDEECVCYFQLNLKCKLQTHAACWLL